MGKDLFDYLLGFPFAVAIICKPGKAVESLEKTFKVKQNRALKYQLITQEEYGFRQDHTSISADLISLKDCDLIVESITEDVDLKRKLFKDLNPVVKQDCVFTSNTSSISPGDLLCDTDGKRDLVGLHFFFPVAMKNIVELNIPEGTNLQAISKIERFLKRINKFYIKLDEKNHFLVNRIFLRLQAGCCHLLTEEKLTVSQIDTLIKKHLFPIGMFEFFDHVGSDIMLASVKNYLKYDPDPEFCIPLIEELEKNVKEGNPGVKTGKGFYNYPDKKEDKIITLKDEKTILDQLTKWYLGPVFEVRRKGICTKEQIEHIVSEYMLTGKSPFILGEEYGFAFE